MLTTFGYERATSLANAVDAARRPGARIHAGGTDLLGCLRDGVFEAERIVSISGVKELAGIARLSDGGLRIGALATLTEIAENDVVRRSYPVLAEATASAASPQLRNQGTIGGNICQRPRCWYFRGDFNCARKGGPICYAADGENRYHCIFGGDGCFIVHPSDTAPALVVLDAKVRIAGPGGNARGVPIESFFVLPKQNRTKENILEQGEIVTELLLPPPDGSRGTYRKVRERGSWDFALASLALNLRLDGRRIRAARVALGGVAPVPWRSLDAERALVGSELGGAIAAAAAADAALAGATPLAQNEYKLDLVRGLFEEALTALA